MLGRRSPMRLRRRRGRCRRWSASAPARPREARARTSRRGTSRPRRGTRSRPAGTRSGCRTAGTAARATLAHRPRSRPARRRCRLARTRHRARAPQARRQRSSSAPLPLARNAVAVAVHRGVGAVGEEEPGFGTGRHLRAIAPSVAAQGLRRRRLPIRACAGVRCGSGRSGGHAIDALGVPSGAARRPRPSRFRGWRGASLPLLGVEVLDRRNLACLRRRTGIALIRHAPAHGAFVHGRCCGCGPACDDQGARREQHGDRLGHLGKLNAMVALRRPGHGERVPALAVPGSGPTMIKAT